ncbi:hypothetical protein EDF56_105206 [Novosphingobium sp. PhB165]|uniref:hypothetical protein n=1 Tax=Novosphingobium sp. PhB165 TaxID=2485105 RepID=UPI0010E9EE7A|nr:hypothetical protein [Novosphingobium sp. PhB165]TCM17862.1 hypothetical protein EDF56_105206 [Novosphingobium sp. PhB165]
MTGFADWDAVVAHALSLEGTVLSTSYGKPAVKVAANGRSFLAVGHEPESSFVLQVDLDTVEMLMATEPETYRQTPHYQGWPAVLVRFGPSDPERVAAMIALARDQAATRKPARPKGKRQRAGG